MKHLALTLEEREQELKKRLVFPVYQWSGVQDDERDRLTGFIYQMPGFATCCRRLEQEFGPDSELFHYGLNRWFNYWSHAGFCWALRQLLPGQIEVKKPYDLSIRRVPFKVNLTIWPSAFENRRRESRPPLAELAHWFYLHQSQTARTNYVNRLFVVLCAPSPQDDWKLKAELTWLRELARRWVSELQQYPDTLFTIPLLGAAPVRCGIILARTRLSGLAPDEAEQERAWNRLLHGEAE
jgi:hypothetical protein